MSRNEDNSLAAVKQAALQNAEGIWPVRANVARNLKQEHVTGIANRNAQGTDLPAHPSTTTQLFKQSDRRHLARSGKIERKLEALRLMRNLNDDSTPDND